MIFLKKYLNQNNKNIYIYFFLLFSVILFYLSIYILSFLKIVNFWSYSQSFMSYSEGFIKRGMFGSLILIFENNFNITPRIFFSSFYVLFYTLNIFLFFSLIRKYSQNLLLLFFLAFCPTLIVFPFNDLGGYQRLDVLSITGILFHSLLVEKYYKNKISIHKYKKTLFFLLFPFIFISILFHEIQLISLPFHFFLTHQVTGNKLKETIKKYILFLLPLFLILFVYPDKNSLKELADNVNDRGIWMDAFLFHSKNIGIDHYLYEFKTNLLIPYNFKIHLLMILLAIMPFYFILYFLDKNQYLIKKSPINYFLMIVSVLPFLGGLLIGDFGRWVNIMSFVAFGYFAQYPLKKELKSFSVLNKNFYKLIFNISLVLLITFYIFFIRIPHCCNLQKSGITLYGGLVNKTIAITNVVFGNSNNPLFNLDSRFKD